MQSSYRLENPYVNPCESVDEMLEHLGLSADDKIAVLQHIEQHAPHGEGQWHIFKTQCGMTWATGDGFDHVWEPPLTRPDCECGKCGLPFLEWADMMRRVIIPSSQNLG
jgi:hypothetical protein